MYKSICTRANVQEHIQDMYKSKCTRANVQEHMYKKGQRRESTHQREYHKEGDTREKVSVHHQLLKDNPKIKYKDLKSDTSRKTNNFIKPFEQAFNRKLTIIYEEHDKNLDTKPKITEKQFLIKDAAEILDMTPQNLNHLLRVNSEINVIEISSRKRYLVESEIEKIRKL